MHISGWTHCIFSRLCINYLHKGFNSKWHKMMIQMQFLKKKSCHIIHIRKMYNNRKHLGMAMMGLYNVNLPQCFCHKWSKPILSFAWKTPFWLFPQFIPLILKFNFFEESHMMCPNTICITWYNHVKVGQKSVLQMQKNKIVNFGG